MKKVILLMLILSVVSCSTKTVDVKSPCVSKAGGPCGDKKPINDWWLKNSV